MSLSHHHIDYSVYDTSDTNYPSTSSSTISLKLLIAYPVALLVLVTIFTVYCSIPPYGVLLLEVRFESHRRLWTRLQYLYNYISHTVCPISSIMQLGQKWECSQITYSAAAVTMSNNQVGGRAGACQHNTNITHHPGSSSQFQLRLPVEGGGILLTTFATRWRIISWTQKPPCGRSTAS